MSVVLNFVLVWVVVAVFNFANGINPTSCTIDSSFTSYNVAAGTSQSLSITVPSGQRWQMTSFSAGSKTSDSIRLEDLLYSNTLIITTGPICDTITPETNYYVYSGSTAYYKLTCNNYFYSCAFWYKVSGVFDSITPAPTTSGSGVTPTAAPTTSGSAPSTSGSSVTPTTSRSQAPWSLLGVYTRTSYNCTGFPSTCDLKCSSRYLVYSGGAGGFSMKCNSAYTGSDCNCDTIEFAANSGFTFTEDNAGSATITDAFCSFGYVKEDVEWNYKGTYDRTSYTCSQTPTDCQVKCSSNYSIYSSGDIAKCYSGYVASDCLCDDVCFVQGRNTDYGTLSFSGNDATVTGPCTIQYELLEDQGCSGCALTRSVPWILLGSSAGLGLILAGVDVFIIQGRRGRSDKTLALIFLGNLFWVFTGGWWFFFFYVLSALVLALTIVLIPFSIKILHLAVYVLLPFGRVVEADDMDSKAQTLSVVANVIWLLIGGVLMCVQHLFVAIICMLTVVLIPVGLKHIELAKNACLPFGKTIQVCTQEIAICGNEPRNNQQETVQVAAITTTNQ